MIPLLLVLGALALCLAGLVGLWAAGFGIGSYNSPNPRAIWLIPAWVAILAGTGLFLALIIVWPYNYFAARLEVQDLRAFQQSRPAYTQTIERARDVVLKGSTPGIVDAGYLEQSKAYTQMVTDYRDKVADYNRRLARLRMLQSAPVSGWFRPDVPADLQPIMEGIGP
ncbi:MAG: hypothetical protein MUO37_04990 [Methyloceanibacter sp.]|nr:hypothetical protein [Methyloceanibacter sp.]